MVSLRLSAHVTADTMGLLLLAFLIVDDPAWVECDV